MRPPHLALAPRMQPLGLGTSLHQPLQALMLVLYNVLSMEITLFQAASCEWCSMKQMSVKQKLDKVLKLFQFLKGTGLIGSRLGVGTGI